MTILQSAFIVVINSSSEDHTTNALNDTRETAYMKPPTPSVYHNLTRTTAPLKENIKYTATSSVNEEIQSPTPRSKEDVSTKSDNGISFSEDPEAFSEVEDTTTDSTFRMGLAKHPNASCRIGALLATHLDVRNRHFEYTSCFLCYLYIPPHRKKISLPLMPLIIENFRTYGFNFQVSQFKERFLKTVNNMFVSNCHHIF